MKDKEKTTELYKRLIMYCFEKEYGDSKILSTEMPYSCGFGINSERRADLFMVTVRGMPQTTVFEIKSSRQDFLKDIKNIQKQNLARLFANYFYYVTPIGLVDVSEIPLWAGLIEFNIEKQIIVDEFCRPKLDYTLQKHSPKLEPMPPTWSLIVSAIRHAVFSNYTFLSKKMIEELQNKFGGSEIIFKQKEIIE